MLVEKKRGREKVGGSSNQKLSKEVVDVDLVVVICCCCSSCLLFVGICALEELYTFVVFYHFLCDVLRYVRFVLLLGLRLSLSLLNKECFFWLVIELLLLLSEVDFMLI